MAKKSFTDNMPAAEQFISEPAGTKAEPATGGRLRRLNIERREPYSARLQLLIKPSTLELVKAEAAAQGCSVNALINYLLEDYLKGAAE